MGHAKHHVVDTVLRGGAVDHALQAWDGGQHRRVMTMVEDVDGLQREVHRGREVCTHTWNERLAALHTESLLATKLDVQELLKPAMCEVRCDEDATRRDT